MRKLSTEPRTRCACGGDLQDDVTILADAIDSGLSLREAQEVLIRNGEKKNAVKQAALRLKKAVSE